ncbi:Conidial yellow pigment biosynthesis polyketide synthase [Cytospora mali]|uniref:Non-reducing polyketide synthase PKS23 n=1 Tax=Cytospora mali TaxID=578113 RepID=PKS23_CYTMA|nr:Conidial yellow pigment biosynthesis polyketide synthase [Valsa mali]
MATLRSHNERKLLIFGPQVPSLNKASLDTLIHSLVNEPACHWMLDVIEGLPKYWKALVKEIPEIGAAVSGEELLADLVVWVKQGQANNGDDSQVPNILLTPLVVLLHLNQYWRYQLELERTRGGIVARDKDPESQARSIAPQGSTVVVETLGFCTGLLSALAVSSSSLQDDLEEYGAVALRLAMLVGAIVDAQQVWDEARGSGRSSMYAIAWRTPAQGDEVQRGVESLSPEAYLSVLTDEMRATVTVTESKAETLIQMLRATNITIADVGLHGRFHSDEEDMRSHVGILVKLCDELPGLQFPHPTRLVSQAYTNTHAGTSFYDACIADSKSDKPKMTLQECALRAILTEQCDWHGACKSVFEESQIHAKGNVEYVCFGADRCIPPTILHRFGPRIVHVAEWGQDSSRKGRRTPEKRQTRSFNNEENNEEDIAVVGMSIKVAGADDVDEFSRVLRTGESQHQEISPDRMLFDTLFREKDNSRRWYGNFIRDVDAFDHKFFKRSPRESSTMDPQQRLFLQASYQAVEQSGYFTDCDSIEGYRNYETSIRDKHHVGVYLGACSGDHERHIACHPANAFTATGNLKSFIPGKVSHYFGWTGPSMVFDTACSASAVAIHTACRNILSGECTAALAGGVTTITDIHWFQNLAGASFLSPTGQCKPFDENADGYCRAEGVACVFLKKMSDAISDGSPILGCIRSSAVYQNQNSTPLFVPNTPSLSQLFRDVLKRAQLVPSDISLVEAHGTGTPVGDPAEYDSIRAALGGPESDRQTSLVIGSVKGHIGHAEGASGVIALIKVLVMMEGNFIPPQASHKKINHLINVLPSDMMEVPTSLRPWAGKFKAALINNYGASGSNASMIVTQPPQIHNIGQSAIRDQRRAPFWLSGFDAKAVGERCTKLQSYLETKMASDSSIALADVSYNCNRQSNRSLPKAMIFACSSLQELDAKLSEAATSSMAIDTVKAKRPVILCFGGQVSTFVGLDHELYDGMSILRHYLDQCNDAIESISGKSIYPTIFSREPIADMVSLQTALFAQQYACAKCWMGCGLEDSVVAVVGHSFGEITALCVSGVLSLQDAVKLVVGRACIIRDDWGPDPGAMMAIDAEETLVHDILLQANRDYDGEYPASIACYNSSRSFTLAGSMETIDAVTATISANSAFSSVRSKRLNVTNAFHSSLVEPLLRKLEVVGHSVEFNDPIIHVERATHTASPAKFGPKFVPDHMRKPVFFSHAVRRLAEQHPSAIWLEAGSNSTITSMASRAQEPNVFRGHHHFQPLNITSGKGFDGLTEATISLWKQGVQVSYWAHHPLDAYNYVPLTLPPYQFDKTRHWLELKSPEEAIKAAALSLSAEGHHTNHKQAEQPASGLWTFVGYQDEATPGSTAGNRPRFRINTASEEYKPLVSGHVIVQTAPICPATLEVDMAIEALFSLHPEWVAEGLQPVLVDMENHSPICADPTREVWIEYRCLDNSNLMWAWSIVSVALSSTNVAEQNSILHVEAQLRIRSPNETAYQAEFARFVRQVNHEHCLSLLKQVDNNKLEILQGRNVYRAFDPVVEYGKLYQGVRRVVGNDAECAGHVQRLYDTKTWLDVPLSDCFSQVGGIWVNCMTDLAPSEMYIATGCELLMRSPRDSHHGEAAQGNKRTVDDWHVLARHHRESDKSYMTDVFVFEASTGRLSEVMLGIQYTKVAKASMSKILARLTTDQSALRQGVKSAVASGLTTNGETSKMNLVDSVTTAVIPQAQRGHTHPVVSASSHERITTQDLSSNKKASKRPDITDRVKNLVADVSGVDASEIRLDSEMADLGIDSLMGMEVAREVEAVFKCKLDPSDLMEATSLRLFVVCISNALYGPDEGIPGDTEGDGLSSSSSDDFRARDTPKSDTPPNGITSQHIDAPVSSSSNFKGIKSTGSTAPPSTSNLTLSSSHILESFSEVKLQSDQSLRDFGLDHVDRVILGASNRLCVALIVEAFENLGCPLRDINPGQHIRPVSYQPQHQRLMNFLLQFLEKTGRLVDRDVTSGTLVRTSIPVPKKTSNALLKELLAKYPEWAVANRLTEYAGRHLAAVLNGTTDGIRVLFGTTEGRELVQALYCDHSFNRMNYDQMRETLDRLVLRLQHQQADIGGNNEPLKILEMGAGTGGTTKILAPFLKSLGFPVEYTFTDLSPSMVANARRKLGEKYPFMRFAVHDIEKPPSKELCDQHVVIASNAIHATHNLQVSAMNILAALRPDGFLMMLEMTQPIPFVDVIFGLLEGWWLFDDGREHAINPPTHWKNELQSAGFGQVDWTDGSLPETKIQKVIIALASSMAYKTLPNHVNGLLAEKPTPSLSAEENAARGEKAETFVSKYTATFPKHSPTTVEETNGGSPAVLPDQTDTQVPLAGSVVLVTGATGSLGSHIVADLAGDPNVNTVVCVNRRGSVATQTRQLQAFSSRGIDLPPDILSKLRFVEADTSKPQLGLTYPEYLRLVQHGTHIIHNAWPMSGTRPLNAFEPQFQTLRNLIDLAQEMADYRRRDTHKANSRVEKIGFQLVSSIGVVGHYGAGRVPERAVGIEAVLPIGYCEAKWVCERMLDETLQKYPKAFNAMVVRLGQIAGSRTSGFWNPVEHFAFLVKSAQSLRAWPDFDGVLQWVPANDVAAAMVDLVLRPTSGSGSHGAYPVYHIDNPVGQPWKEMTPVLADALGIPTERIIPFQEWIQLVRRSPLDKDTDNPAARLVDFLDSNFERMSCGGLILDTARSQEHSKTMASLGPVSFDTARQYISAWKQMEFLK